MKTTNYEVIAITNKKDILALSTNMIAYSGLNFKLWWSETKVSYGYSQWSDINLIRN